jgi:hypothetical protein
LYLRGTEVHLIDTPGFDDDKMADHEVLDRIALWINTVYSQGWKIGGIIYLFDIAGGRLRGGGEQSIRILEEMTGRSRWNHISLVTTKWGFSRSPAGEAQRERELQTLSMAWKALREGDRPARVCQFINTRESALEIIQWHLDQSFEPEIVREMASPTGPRSTLGNTSAGQVIRRTYMPALRRAGDTQSMRQVEEVLSHQFNNMQVRAAIQGLVAQLIRVKRERRAWKGARWAIRLSMVGSIVMVKLLAQNPVALSAAVAVADQTDRVMVRRQTLKDDEISQIEAALANMAIQANATQ